MRIFIFFSESGARGAMKALAPELRAPVYARSLPDDVVLRNMRRALAALGEDDPARGDGVSAPENATSGGDDVAAGASSSASVVTALAAVELRRETRLWMAMMYKSTSQHRRAVHFQRMRGVTRSLRALAALDVGAAAVALRNGLRDGVSEEARETASSSPAVAAGAHALWKLPPRALWDDLSLRLRETARVAAEADDDMLAAAEALVGQLAHTFFMPFALVALAALARLRAAAHQLVADAAAAYNVLAPLLRGGIMPPPGLEPVTSGGDPPPEALACEWRAVSRRAAAGGGRATRSSTRSLTKTGGGRNVRVFPSSEASSEGGGQKEKDSGRTHESRSGTRATDRVAEGAESLAAAGKRVPTRPSARFVPAVNDDAATVGDEDWSWRVLPPVPVSLEGALDAGGSRARVREPAPPSGAPKEFRDGNVSAGEDLGAAVPRRVRGVGAKLDRGEARTSTGVDTGASAVRVPSYSRATFASGLGIVTNPTVTNASGSGSGAASAAAPEDETETQTRKAKEKDETPSFDFASLASGLAPATGDAAGPAVERAAGGKKRRRPGASKPAEPPPPPPAEKKKNKKKKKTDPKSAVEAAMRLLLGE